MLMNMNKEV